jgi:hypothetical protein
MSTRVASDTAGTHFQLSPMTFISGFFSTTITIAPTHSVSLHLYCLHR